MVSYWWYVVDIFLAILPVVLLFGGFIALMAGIKKTGLRAKLTKNNKKAAADVMEDKQ
jgi:di/tricarboxylate transporter